MTDIELDDLDWTASRLERMRRFSPGSDYLALRVSADHGGAITWSCDSWWVGESDKRPEHRHWEVRKASPADPELRTRAWRAMGQQWFAVEDDEQLAIFLRLGGNALVDVNLAEARLSKVVGSHDCVQDGLDESGTRGLRGFIAFDDVPEDAAVARAPRRKLRMRVLERDGFRCVVCGRRPRDHIDLELHVHHLIPWRLSGPTALDNLVTLCGTCHKGLRTDFEPKLRGLAGLPGQVDTWDSGNVELDGSLKRYRGALSSVSDDPETLTPLWLLADQSAAREREAAHRAGSGRDRISRAVVSSNRLTIPWTIRDLTDALYPEHKG